MKLRTDLDETFSDLFIPKKRISRFMKNREIFEKFNNFALPDENQICININILVGSPFPSLPPIANLPKFNPSEIIANNNNFQGKTFLLPNDLKLFLLEFDTFLISGGNSFLFSYGKNSLLEDSSAEKEQDKFSFKIYQDHLKSSDFDDNCIKIEGFYLSLNSRSSSENGSGRLIDLSLYLNNELICKITLEALTNTHIKLVILSDVILLSSGNEFSIYNLNEKHKILDQESALNDKNKNFVKTKNNKNSDATLSQKKELLNKLNSYSEKIKNNIVFRGKFKKFCDLEQSNVTIGNGRNGVMRQEESLIGKVSNVRINNLEYVLNTADTTDHDVIDTNIHENAIQSLYLPLILYKKKILQDKKLTVECQVFIEDNRILSDTILLQGFDEEIFTFDKNQEEFDNDLGYLLSDEEFKEKSKYENPIKWKIFYTNMNKLCVFMSTGNQDKNDVDVDSDSNQSLYSDQACISDIEISQLKTIYFKIELILDSPTIILYSKNKHSSTLSEQYVSFKVKFDNWLPRYLKFGHQDQRPNIYSLKKFKYAFKSVKINNILYKKSNKPPPSTIILSETLDKDILKLPCSIILNKKGKLPNLIFNWYLSDLTNQPTKEKLIYSSYNLKSNFKRNPYFNQARSQLGQNANYYTNYLIINSSKVFENTFSNHPNLQSKLPKNTNLGNIICKVTDLNFEKSLQMFIITQSSSFETKYINFIYDFIKAVSGLTDKTKITLSVVLVFVLILGYLLVKRDNKGEEVKNEGEDQKLLSHEAQENEHENDKNFDFDNDHDDGWL